MNREIRIIEYCVCRRCGYGWWPVKPKDQVSNCPRCRARTWNRAKVNRQGYRDNRESTIWVDRVQEKEK